MDCETQAVIIFLNAKKVSWKEIYLRLCAVYGETAVMNRQTVYHWIQRFNDGHTSTYDDLHSGYPYVSVNNKSASILHALLESDRR